MAYRRTDSRKTDLSFEKPFRETVTTWQLFIQLTPDQKVFYTFRATASAYRILSEAKPSGRDLEAISTEWLEIDLEGNKYFETIGNNTNSFEKWS